MFTHLCLRWYILQDIIPIGIYFFLWLSVCACRDQRCHLQKHHLPSLRWGRSLTWSLPRVLTAASKPQRVSCFCLPSPGVASVDHHSASLHGSLGSSLGPSGSWGRYATHWAVSPVWDLFWLEHFLLLVLSTLIIWLPDHYFLLWLFRFHFCFCSVLFCFCGVGDWTQGSMLKLCIPAPGHHWSTCPRQAAFTECWYKTLEKN